MATRRTILALLSTASLGGLLFGLRGGAAATPPGTYPVERTDAEWLEALGPERYRVLRTAGTERAFTSDLLHEDRKGAFGCAGCANGLFDSATKFESGTGWPSFWQALPGSVAEHADSSFGMVRTEVACARCGGHLGHVFDDGPRPTGLRYCMNGLALRFEPSAA